MKWFEDNLLLLNYDKTDYLFCGPYFRKNMITGDNDLTELHQCAPEYAFQHKVLPQYMYHQLDDEGAHFSEININGEFIFDELHRTVPLYLLKEHINIDRLIVESLSLIHI